MIRIFGWLLAVLTILASTVGLTVSVVHAQVRQPRTEAREAPIPRARAVLRFLTDNDFPPFNFIDEEGVLAGFHVDLARAICLEVSATCDIKTKAWGDLLPSLARGEADAVIAGHRISVRTVQGFEFSERYFFTPARFVGKKGVAVEISPDGLDGRRIGVAVGTAHEAYVRVFFRLSRITTFESPELARDAVMTGLVDVIADDGIGLSLWLAGALSRDCCEFKGGPFFDPKYFGDGLAIALPKTDPDLRLLINAGLQRVRQSGRYEEIVQRYFANRVY
jgi:polar amino acid transport system substrate-binding protein